MVNNPIFWLCTIASIIATFMFLRSLRELTFQATMENAFRYSQGLKPKSLFNHILDMAKGQSLTLLVAKYTKEHNVGYAEALRTVVAKIKDVEK